MKVVINKCYGGFGLSHAAIMKYAEYKDTPLWVEPSDPGSPWNFYYTQDPATLTPEGKNDAFFDTDDIRRNDPVLVRVVEELGEEANGECAELQIVTIPDGIDWEIEEYDGREWVSECHQTWG